MKKKKTKTEIEVRFQRFDCWSKLLMYSMLLISLVCAIFFLLVNSDGMKVLFGCILFAITFAIIFIAPQIAKKRTIYMQQIRDERESVDRVGIFKEIYDEYKHDGFEFNLTFDKLLFSEYYNNTIDISLKKNNHELAIEIDESTISFILDEETDFPIEQESPLTNFETMDLVYAFINDFINTHT
ncbi:MAG: hypothetical protein E7574_03975 [Ruminococcaceae bacterium]|nr:hypothetical protein [Oscillospiraceae bacterium]